MKILWIIYINLVILFFNKTFGKLNYVHNITGQYNENLILSYFDKAKIIQQWSGHNLKLQCSNNDFRMFNVHWYFKPCVIDLYQNICKNVNFDDWIKISCDTTTMISSSSSSFPTNPTNNICESKNTILHINNATENNIGLYKCTIQPFNNNYYKEDNSKMIEIQIQTFYVDIKNYTKLSVTDILQMPIFMKNLFTNITATCGTKVIFQCRVYSRLHTTIRWFKNIQNTLKIKHKNSKIKNMHLYSYNDYNDDNNVIDNDHNYNSEEFNKNILKYFNKTYKRIETPKEKIISSNVYLSKLIINNVTEMDQGNYACVAVNIRGHNIFEMFLQVVSPSSSSSSSSLLLSSQLSNNVTSFLDYSKMINNYNSSLSSSSTNFLLFFLIPVGLALFPISLWLFIILIKMYSNCNAKGNENENSIDNNYDCDSSKNLPPDEQII